MKKVRSVLSRYRLMLNVLALVFVLSTFAAPVPAQGPGWNFEDGCWNWNQEQGCINCQRCCVHPENEYACIAIPCNVQ
jgi:hypothetical protein